MNRAFTQQLLLQQQPLKNVREVASVYECTVQCIMMLLHGLHLHTDDFSGLLEVTHSLLDQIKWKDAVSGEIKKVSIYNSSAGTWEKVATRLGLSESEITTINRGNRGNPEECVTAVFRQWLQNASGMKHAKKFPKSWEGLIRLLNESDLIELAKTVRKAILSPQNEAKGDDL